MKGSLIIVGFFVLGTICGVCHLLPFDIAETNISYYALCALMFSVGLSVGNDPQTLKNFRSLNPLSFHHRNVLRQCIHQYSQDNNQIPNQLSF